MLLSRISPGIPLRGSSRILSNISRDSFSGSTRIFKRTALEIFSGITDRFFRDFIRAKILLQFLQIFLLGFLHCFPGILFRIKHGIPSGILSGIPRNINLQVPSEISPAIICYYITNSLQGFHPGFFQVFFFLILIMISSEILTKLFHWLLLERFPRFLLRLFPRFFWQSLHYSPRDFSRDSFEDYRINYIQDFSRKLFLDF